MKNRKLTPKQQKFADYYIETGNITQSAISAGYSRNTASVIGSENLNKPYIKAYIKGIMDKLASERVLTMQEALEFTTSVVRGEITEEVVVSGFDGVEKVEKKADIRDRQRAAEEMIRILSIGNNQDLKNKLLEAQIKKILAETKNEESGVTKITIVDEWAEEDEG